MYNKRITPSEKMNLANFIDLYKLRIQKETEDGEKYFEDLYVCTDIIYTNKSDPLKDPFADIDPDTGLFIEGERKDPVTGETVYSFDIDSENWDIILKKDTSLEGVTLENLIKDYGNKMVEQIFPTEDEAGIHIFKLTIK
jgi:hypothetical protein